MADEIQRLIIENGLTEEQAQSILSASAGDPEKTKSLIASLAKTYFVLKIRFYGTNTDMCGLLNVVCDQKNHRFERVLAVVSGSQQDIFRTEVGMPWRQFEEAVLTTRMTSHVAQQTTQDLQKFIQSRLRGDLGRTLLEQTDEDTLPQIKALMGNEIGKSIADGRVSVDARIERVSELDFKGLLSAQKEPAPPPQQPAPSREEDAEDVRAELAKAMEFTVRVNPVLAPVSGCPAGELIVGDLIMVKIVDQGANSTVSKAILESKFPSLKDVYAMEVTNIAPGDFQKVQIAGLLKDGIIGKAVISAELKVKRRGIGGESSEEFLSQSAFRSSDRRWWKHPYVLPIIGGLSILFLLLLFLVMTGMDLF